MGVSTVLQHTERAGRDFPLVYRSLMVSFSRADKKRG